MRKGWHVVVKGRGTGVVTARYRPRDWDEPYSLMVRFHDGSRLLLFENDPRLEPIVKRG